jgi:hypothetical protein
MGNERANGASNRTPSLIRVQRCVLALLSPFDLARRRHNQRMVKRILSLVLVGVVTASGEPTGFTYLAGYEPQSDVTAHAKIDVDMKASAFLLTIFPDP